jgi:hypothetical protein
MKNKNYIIHRGLEPSIQTEILRTQSGRLKVFDGYGQHVTSIVLGPAIGIVFSGM